VPESLIAELDSRPPNAGSAFFQKSRIAAADNFGGMRAFYDSKVAKVGREVYLATARRLGFIESFAGGPDLKSPRIISRLAPITAKAPLFNRSIVALDIAFSKRIDWRLKSEPTIRNREEREIGPGTLRYPPRVRRCFA